MSPLFKEENGFSFKIFSNEEERIHVHVYKAENEAKYWPEPDIELAYCYGFNSKELKIISEIIERNGNDFKEKYRQHIR
jgi:hypothetical protein